MIFLSTSFVQKMSSCLNILQKVCYVTKHEFKRDRGIWTSLKLMFTNRPTTSCFIGICSKRYLGHCNDCWPLRNKRPQMFINITSINCIFILLYMITIVANPLRRALAFLSSSRKHTSFAYPCSSRCLCPSSSSLIFKLRVFF